MDDRLRVLLNAQAKTGRPFRLSVEGVSMRPLLREGDVILACREAAYAVGDIVVFHYVDGSLLVHRVVRTRDGVYTCKGDNALRMELVLARQIVGRVYAVERDGAVSPLPDGRCSDRLRCRLSARIGDQFMRAPDPEAARRTGLYRLYARLFLREREKGRPV